MDKGRSYENQGAPLADRRICDKCAKLIVAREIRAIEKTKVGFEPRGATCAR